RLRRRSGIGERLPRLVGPECGTGRARSHGRCAFHLVSDADTWSVDSVRLRAEGLEPAVDGAVPVVTVGRAVQGAPDRPRHAGPARRALLRAFGLEDHLAVEAEQGAVHRDRGPEILIELVDLRRVGGIDELAK